MFASFAPSAIAESSYRGTNPCLGSGRGSSNSTRVDREVLSLTVKGPPSDGGGGRLVGRAGGGHRSCGRGGVRSMGMVWEAVKGVAAEVRQQPSAWLRLRVGATLAFRLVSEVAGIFESVPYGVRAFVLYNSVAHDDVDTTAAPHQGTISPSVPQHLSWMPLHVLLLLRLLLLNARAAILSPLQKQRQQQPATNSRDQSGAQASSSPSGAKTQATSSSSSLSVSSLSSSLGSLAPSISSSSSASLDGEQTEGRSQEQTAEKEAGAAATASAAVNAVTLLGAGGVRLLRDVRYGPKERNVLDIYLPPLPHSRILSRAAAKRTDCASAVDTRSQPNGLSWREEVGGADAKKDGWSSGRRVLVFVHGGVWASGDKWQYAPLAARCALEGGAVVVVPHYTLYPQALASEQVQELSSALTWTLDNVSRYGGDPSHVFLSGHSSGAHLCALVLWKRAAARLHSKLLSQQIVRQQADFSSTAATASSQSAAAAGAVQTGAAGRQQHGLLWVEQEDAEEAQADERLALKGPTAFATAPDDQHAGRCGACGVGTSAAEEDDKEDVRMPHMFVGLSGVYDIAVHLRHEQRRGVAALSCMTPANGNAANFRRMSPSVLFAELADVVEHGIESEGEGAATARQHDSEVQFRETSMGQEIFRQLVRGRLAAVGKLSSPSPADVARAVRSFGDDDPLVPPCLLLCSPGDIVVPPDTSDALASALKRVGVKARVLSYPNVSHGAFACWSSPSIAPTPPAAAAERAGVDLTQGTADGEAEVGASGADPGPVVDVLKLLQSHAAWRDFITP